MHSVVTQGRNLLEPVNRCVVTVLLSGMSGFVSGNGGSSLTLWVKLILSGLTRVGWKFHLVCKEMQVVDDTHDAEQSVFHVKCHSLPAELIVQLSVVSCDEIKKQPMCAVFADITYLPTCNAISIGKPV